MSKQSLIEAAFFGALEKETAEERAAYLESACGGDAEVRLQVDKMLKVHSQVGDFLQQPVVEKLPAIAELPEPTQLFDTANSAGEQSDVQVSTLAFLTPSTRPDSLGRIGHYEVLEVLGHGGFGIVFRAFDETLQRVVAVKVLSPQLAVTSPARKRFLREARSSAKIRHQNVVQVYSVEEQPLPYLVMEYIPGETLQQRIERTGPFDLNEVVHIGRQIAEGLAAAHAQGVIHRDIKPANVLVEAGVYPCVKITDFGLARAADDASLTQSGAIAGTPMFMAPEQARGETLDQRADLFSLGSVLYTICSGRPPFRAPSTVAVLKRVAEETPRPIPEIIPEVPKWLCDIITRLHAKRPEDRISTAREVADLLARGAAAIQQPTHFPVIAKEGTSAADKPVGKNAGSSVPALRVRSRFPRWAIASLALLLVVAGLGFAEGTGITNFRGTVVRLFSPEGTLVVEVDDPEVSIQIDGSDLVITGAGVKEIRLKAGQHTVEARKDGQLVRRELTTVTKNGRQVVRISQEPPASMQVGGQGGREPDSQKPSPEISAPSPADDPDRRAAEYVLSVGGAVQVNEQAEFIQAVANLPPGPLRLTTMHLNSNAQVNDADLARFKGCKSLIEVRLNGASRVSDAGIAHFKDCKNLAVIALDHTQVSDAGLAHFGDLKKLSILGLSGTLVSDAGLANFKDCKNLRSLDLENTKVGDAGAAHFQDCKDLIILVLSGTQVTDAGLAYFHDSMRLTHLHLANMKVGGAGLAHLKGCQNLETIDLRRTQVSDEGLVHLKGFQKLVSVNLRETQVTPQGIADLNQALPGCQIESETDPDRRAAEYVLSIGGAVQVQVNAQREFIESSSKLPRQPFQLVTVHLFSNAHPTDAGLAEFKDCEHLEEVRFNGSEHLTDAGFSHLKNCTSLIGLGLDGTKVTDEGLASFKDFKNLLYLSLSNTQVSDAGLAAFSGCKDLRFLQLNDLSISDAGLGAFQGCQNLMSLTLINTKVSDAGLAHFGTCKHLTILDLNGTKVTDSGLAYFNDCKDLTHLNLAGTTVTDAGLVHLQDLKNLKTIDLKETPVTAQGIAKLKQELPDCKIAWEPQVARWPTDAPPPAIAPFDAKTARAHQEAWAKYLGVKVAYTNSIGMQFMLIPPGEFTMGSTPAEIAAVLPMASDDQYWETSIKSEAPEHKVILTQPFYLGSHEVTQGQYRQVLETNPSRFAPTGSMKDQVAGLDTTSHPVEMVSWFDAVEFCSRLNQKESSAPRAAPAEITAAQARPSGYRLPTEAEWEFASRAGTTTRCWVGNSELDLLSVGWFGSNSGHRTHAVGELPANPFGLCDMHGNVGELLHDWWDPTYYAQFQNQSAVNPVGPETGLERVLRSGNWSWRPFGGRSANRSQVLPEKAEHTWGFRTTLTWEAVRRATQDESTAPDNAGPRNP